MKIFSTLFLVLVILFLGDSVVGQSVLDPTDPVITYNGSTTPAQPADGQIGKWIRTRRLSWNTDSFKCYIYKGVSFRLRFPKTYKPGVNDGKKYPMLLFFHGLGEAGPITDNEYQMYHGGDVFNAAVNNGTYDGYVLFFQSLGYWGVANYRYAVEIINYMIANNKLDPFRVTDDGLSAGGQGTWEMLTNQPTYIAAALPISHIELGYAATPVVNNLKFTPIWNCEGGLDGSPAPPTGEQVRDYYLLAGGNFAYKEYPTLGHGCWDSVWQEPNFWPFINNAYMSNPWTLFGRTQFCPGDPINVTIGLVPGMQAYQWRKDGVIIPNATSNTIQVTVPGVYDAQVERNGIWSDWSHTPVQIGVKPPTVTPPISVSGLMSDVIPGADGLTSVNLQVPDSGYTSYTWEKVGSSTVIGNARILNVTQPGQYIVAVTQQYGCSSVFSPPFTVVNANGGNAPTPASNLVATALSFTQVQLTWAQDPNPAFQETGFEIYRSTTSGGPYTFAGLTPKDTLNFIDNKLTPNIKYFYTVRAVNGTGASSISNEANAVTQSDQTPPTAPGNLRVVATSQSSISVAWDSAQDNVSVSKYAVYVNGVKRSTTTQTNYIVDGLQTAQQYAIYVVAIDGTGNASVRSNQLSAAAVNSGLVYKYYTTATQWSVLPNFSTLTPVMTGTMPNVSIANATQTTNFGYIWQGYINIPVAGSYTFATSSDDGSALWFNSYTPTGTPLVNNDGLHGTTTVTGTITLQPGTYPICIEFMQGGGGAAMSISWACSALFGDNSQHAITDNYFVGTFTPGGTAPAKPTVIKAVATAYNKVNLSWTDNSTNESGFEIYRTTASTSAYSIVGTAAAGATTFTDSTASASTTYFYKVQAVNQYGASGFDPASLGGIQYAYYNNFTASSLKTLPTLTPTATGSLTNISLSPASSTTNYAFKFSGTINIPAANAGVYTFYTASDDGSNLYVGGFDSTHLVVRNDFLQGTTERSGTVTLAAGSYPVYVTYYQQGGGAALTASYQGPGISKQNIPDAAFINAQSTATTFTLPLTPSKPYNVAGSALSPSKIALSWQDSSATVTGFKLYRSISDTTHFNLLSNLAASPAAYTDTSLFANQTYSYKIVAVGVGGNSGNSSTVTVTTKDNAPVIMKLTDRSSRYGISTVIPLSATDVDGDALSFSIQNNPSFVSLVDNGNKTSTLTLNPASSDQGVYNGIRIIVNDGHGGRDTTQFNLTVNDNYDPVMDTITNYTINEHDVLTIPLNAMDQNASDTLTYTVSNVPNTYSIVPVSNGKANLTIQTSFLGAGVYNAQVVITDGRGGRATRSFVLTVLDKDPNLAIYTRLMNATPLGTPWNSMATSSATNLKDAHGNTTNVGINIQNSSFIVGSNGPNTGNNSGVYPDAVLQEYMYFGLPWQPQTVNTVISGLDITAKYNITLFAGTIWQVAPDNGSTNFTIGNQTISLYVQNNTKNTATFNGVAPAADGTITFTVAKGSGATAGYLNSIVITNLYDDGTAPANPTSLSGQYLFGQGVQLSWKNPAYNASGFQIYRSTSAGGTFTQIGTSSRLDSLTYVDTSAASNTSYYYAVKATNAHGSSDTSNVFTLVTPDRIPSIAAIANVTLKNNQTVSINVSAKDDPTDHIRLSAANLPSFATFTDNGDGTGVVKVTPKAGITGVFSGVTITAKDNSDSSRSSSFIITVTDKDVSSVYVSFSDGLYLGSKPWNNMTAFPNAGAGVSNLLDDGNAQTGISLSVLDNFEGIIDRGMHPDNGQSIYPDSVMKSALFESTTNAKRIQISGLSAAKKYNFVFFNSHDFGLKCVTNFTINGQTVTLDAMYNNNKTVQINGITADATGKVLITMAKNSGADLAVLSTLIIQSYDPALTLLNPTDLRVVGITTNSLKLQWQDRSFDETGFQIWRAADAAGSQYSLLKTVAANVASYTDSSLAGNSTYYYIVRAIKGTQNSAYTSLATGTTYSSNVYIQCTGVNDAPAPWNNTNAAPVLGFTWNSFNNDKGAPTSTGMAITSAFSEVHPLGMNTGNNSGFYPDNLLQYSYYVFPGVTGALKVTGLNTGLKYNLTFIGSTASFGDFNTAYTVNGQTYYLNASMNIGYGTLVVPGLTPDGNGEISVVVKGGGSSTATGGYLNAFIVSDYSPAAFPVPQPATVNNKPVISPIANKTMRYGTTLVIPVTATDADGDTLSFTIQNNPAFGTFVDNGNGTASLTLNPSSSNQGTFNNITLIVSDNKGGKDTAKFNLVVNNNYVPVISATQNYTVLEGASLTMNLSATDQNAGDVLTWTVTGLPNTFTLSSPSNGAEKIILVPNAGTAGAYTVVASVSDGNGGQASASFTVTVTKPANKTIYAKLSLSYPAGAPWNNLTTQVTNNLKDADGNTTNVNVNIQNNSFIVGSNGPNTGNNSGVYPDAVLREYMYFGLPWQPNPVPVVISGLDVTAKYNITLFAGTIWEVAADNGSTNFTIGGQTFPLYVQNNTQNVITFNNIAPAADGTITFTAAKGTGATAGYLNAFVLSAATGTTGTQQRAVTSAAAAALTPATLNIDSIISAYPNPFTQSFTLSVPSENNNDRVQVNIYNGNGQQVYAKEFDNLIIGKNLLQIDANAAMAARGVYMVRIIYMNKKQVMIKMIKI